MTVTQEVMKKRRDALVARYSKLMYDRHVIEVAIAKCDKEMAALDSEEALAMEIELRAVALAAAPIPAPIAVAAPPAPQAKPRHKRKPKAEPKTTTAAKAKRVKPAPKQPKQPKSALNFGARAATPMPSTTPADEFGSRDKMARFNLPARDSAAAQKEQEESLERERRKSEELFRAFGGAPMG